MVMVGAWFVMLRCRPTAFDMATANVQYRCCHPGPCSRCCVLLLIARWGSIRLEDMKPGGKNNSMRSEAYITLGRLSHVKMRHKSDAEGMLAALEERVGSAFDSAVRRVRGEVGPAPFYSACHLASSTTACCCLQSLYEFS